MWLKKLELLWEEKKALLEKDKMLVSSIFSSSHIVFYLFASLEAHLNSLLDNKMLDWSKLKQIAANILKCM